MIQLKDQSECRVVLFAHGSQSINAQQFYAQMIDGLMNRFGQESVKLAYLQFVGPRLEEVVLEAKRAGKRNIRILPLFLAPGNHIEFDLPDQVDSILGDHPELNIEVRPPIGKDARFLELVDELTFETTAPVN